MTTLDDLPWPPPETPANPAAPPPRRHRHVWVVPRVRCFPGCPHTPDEYNCSRYEAGVLRMQCAFCDRWRNEARSKLGRRNRKRGGELQAWAIRRLGLVNLPGSSGHETDGHSVIGANAAFVAQVKSGLQYPGWAERILDQLPRTDGRIPLLAIVKTPGPGNRRRALVVLDIDDWVDLHVAGGEE